MSPDQMPENPVAKALFMIEHTAALQGWLHGPRAQKTAEALSQEPYFDDLVDLFLARRSDSPPDTETIARLSHTVAQYGAMDIPADSLVYFSGPEIKTAEAHAARDPSISVIHGTAAGAALEIMQLFSDPLDPDAGGPIPFAIGTAMWDLASERTALETPPGHIRVYVNPEIGSHPDSTFRSVELPALLAREDSSRFSLSLIRVDKQSGEELVETRPLEQWLDYSRTRMSGMASRQGVSIKPDGTVEFSMNKPTVGGAGSVSPSP